MTQRTDDTGKLVLRLAVGGLLFFHGLAKVRDSDLVAAREMMSARAGRCSASRT